MAHAHLHRNLAVRLVSWLKHGVNSAEFVGLILVWAIHLRAGFDDPWGSFQLRTFCGSLLY